MKKQLATVILALSAVAGVAETKKVPAPDGVNELTVEDGRVIATTTALALTPEETEQELAAFDSAVINAQETLKEAGEGEPAAVIEMVNGKPVRKVGKVPQFAPSQNGKPFLQKTVRSPLGKEIDSTRRFTMKMASLSSQRDNQLYSFITNLAARVETLEAAESNRLARVEAAKAAAAKRREARETKPDNRQILQNAIRRGKKVEKEVK